MTENRNKDQTSPKSRNDGFTPALFGRYYLVDRISKGGMSHIYLAKTMGIDGFQKPLVIKKLFPEFSGKTRFVQRFVTEAKTLAQLNHANIVQILDMGVVEGEYFIAMEHIEGRNVAHLLSKAKKTGNPPPLEFALYVALELAKGLAYAHKKSGIDGESLMLVHQDVNSFNVMISFEGQVKIIDFGIARIFLDRTSWNALPVAGKLLYFSPEQLKGKSIDRRVDIYGTGALLYELVTGERLVEHQETVADTVKMILEMDVQERIEQHDEIHPDVKPVLARALALEPQDRYPWIEEMTDHLREVVKKCDLELDPLAFSPYIRDLFQREIELDRLRMRKLMSAVPGPGKPAPPVGPDHARSASGFLDHLLNLQSEGVAARTDKEPPAGIGLRRIEVARGRTIFREGDPGSDVYVVEKGKVRAFLKAGPLKQTVALLGEGDIIGETGLLDESVRCLRAQVVEDATLLRIDRDTFMKIVPQEYLREVIVNLVRKLRDTTFLLGCSLVEDPLSRFIYALIVSHRRNSSRSGMDIELKELRDLFRLEDSDRVRKYLDKLQALGVLDHTDETVRIKNFEKLENILKLLAGGGKLSLKL